MRKLIVLVGLVVWCSSASAGTPKCEPEELVTIEQCRADGGDKSTAPRGMGGLGPRMVKISIWGSILKRPPHS